MKTKKIFINQNSNLKDVPIERAYVDFTNYCKVKNLSPDTMKYYDVYFKQYNLWFDSCGVINCHQITDQLIKKYVLKLAEQYSNAISINTHVRALRVFANYCMDMGYCTKFKIEFLKTQKEIKETYTDNEIEILLKKPDIRKCQFFEFRDWVIVNYLLATGNRLSSIINIKIKDINADNDCIHLTHTKNKKQQIMPLTKSMISVLREYLIHRGGEPNDYLFCNVFNEQLTKNAIQKTIQKYNRTRGVAKTSIHLFRHTFAKKWILAGGDIFRLQKILGHSTLDVVREYVNMFDYDLLHDLDKFNPLEQFSNTRHRIGMK